MSEQSQATNRFTVGKALLSCSANIAIAGLIGLSSKFNQAVSYFQNKKYLKKWPHKYISPQERQMLREIYFKARGYDFEIPSDGDARQELAYKLSTVINPDFDAAIMLFDPELDRNDANWLFRLGCIYSQLDFNQNNFKPARGTIFYIRSAELGNSTAQYNLGVTAARGFDDEPDLAQAEFWYTQAYKNGIDFAYNELVYLRRNNPSFYIKYYSNPQAKILEFDSLIIDSDTLNGAQMPDLEFASMSTEEKVEFLINKAYALKHDTFEGQINIRRRILSGKSLGLGGYNVDKLITEEDYDRWLIEKRGVKNYDSHYEYACYRMAIRYILGIGMDVDCNQANNYLDKIPNRDATTDINVRSLHFQKMEVREMSRKMASAQWQYHDVRRLVTDIATGRLKIDKVHEKIENGEIKITDQMVEYLNQVENLMTNDDPQNRDKWRDLLAHAQARLLGFSLDQLRTSTMKMGPVYNAVNEETGLPILGHLLRAAGSIEEANQTYAQTGMFVPAEGIVHLKGIKAFDDGSFHLDVISTEKGSGTPAMILPEDIDVALTIIFGERINLEQVFLSLEEPESERVRKDYGHNLKHNHMSLRHKVWSPKWLGHTHLGRTLYATDELIARVCWNLKDFDIVKEEDALHSASSTTIQAIVEDLILTGGRNAESTSRRVMIRPSDHVMITSHHTKKASRKPYRHIKIEQFDMFVEGDYYLGDEGMIARDDPTFEHGRMTQKLTRRFNDVASAMPIFERGRQITMMLYAFQKLRDSGWKPNQILQSQIDRATQRYQSLPKQGLDELLMQPLPFKRKGPRV